LECELSWLFYVCGTMLSSIMGSGDNKNAELQLEAQICATIFTLTSSINTRLEKATPNLPPCRYIDEGLLFIFGQFRQNHIRAPSTRMRARGPGYNADPSQQIYSHLSNYLGNQVSQDIILSAIVQKVITNLKCPLIHTNVVKASLNLLHHIATGFSSSQVLSSSEIARTFLLSHGSTNFPFMTQIHNLKQRTLFYEILTMILMQDDHIDLFDDFMKPFENTFEQLENISDYTSREVCITGVGLARDLTGFLKAISSSRGYMAFFNWIYPRYFRIFLRLFEPWWDQSFVIIPMLKFIAAFTYQKFQRIEFPISSPNGILLFREVSKVLVTYGHRVLNAEEIHLDDPYKDRYKAIMVCMTILHRALSAQYVNFGMFEIYQDPALTQAIMVVINLVRKFRYEVLMSYRKISLAWWKLLELLFRQHFEILASDDVLFDYLFKSLYEGTQHQLPVQSSPVLHGVDHIFMWVHTNSQKKNPPPLLNKMKTYMSQEQNKRYVLKLFISLLNIHLFGNETTTWSICRPLYSIVLVFPEVWQAYLQQMLKHQSQETHQIITEKFNSCLADLDMRVADNRDHFIKNLITFKNEVKQYLKKWDEAENI